MANRQRGEIDLELDGKTYTLVLDLNAMCELEDLLSTPDKPVSMQDVIRGLMASRMTYTRAFFWACLRRHHGEITLKGVSELAQSAGGLAPFVEKIGKLLAMLTPEDKDAAALKDKNGRPMGAAEVASLGTGRASRSKRGRSASAALSSGH